MLILRCKSSTTIPIEAEGITPDALADKLAHEIAALPVAHGNREERLGEFFHVEGDASDREIRIEGDCSRVKWIGAGMTAGKIAIHGPVGMHLGAEMRGGLIHVHGSVADWAGAEMRGGRIHIHGDAGHLVGAAYRGSRRGMRGGIILVDGKAGAEVGAVMRRGLIAIGGASGDFVGASMIAGTICVFGSPGVRCGAGMKRGTLAFFSDMPSLLPSFRHNCDYQPIFMRLYLRQLQKWGFSQAQPFLRGKFQRFSGDLIAQGKGEILHWQE